MKLLILIEHIFTIGLVLNSRQQQSKLEKLFCDFQYYCQTSETKR